MITEDERYSISNERIEKRCVILEKIYLKLLDNLPGIKQDTYKINQSLVVEAVKNYFVDIERLKFSHNIVDPDKAKIAGFTAYWILKTRPIQIVSNDVDKSDFYINEMFSLSVFFSIFRN